jgi:hypothetical protein
MENQNKHYRLSKNRFIGTAITAVVLVLVITVCIFSCAKHESAPVPTDDAKIPNLKVLTAQPLPGGRAYFSAVVGNMDATGATDVRVENFSFTAATGVVNATIWEWNSADEKGKTLFNTHTCTQDGISKTNSVYAPTGWQVPAGGSYNRSGVYTYVSGVLTINWDAPWATVHESWNVTNPDAATARLDFASSNYGLTHGRGFGSNTAFGGTAGTNYKTLSQIPLTSYAGQKVSVALSGGTITVTPATAGAWATDALNITGWTSSANGNTLHADLPTSGCDPANGCAVGNTHTGIIYHLASSNNSRYMVYNHYCACLPQQTDFPAYSGNLHPYAFIQIIDDNHNLRGFLGIEEQDQAGSSGYQYQLKAYFQ